MSFWTDRIANSSREDYPRLLYDASVTGKQEDVLTLLAKGAMILPIDEKQNTALHMAAKHGLSRNLQALTSYVADVDIENRKGRTPLWYAAVKQHYECLTILLNHPIKPKRHLDDLLERVFKQKLYVSVSVLTGYLLQEKGEKGCEKYGGLIESAVVNKDKAMIEVFMNRGFSINGGFMRRDGEESCHYEDSPDLSSQYYESNPLLIAIKEKDLDMVQWLVSWGAKIDIPVIVPGYLPEKGGILYFAARKSSSEIAKFLFDTLSARPLKFD